MLESIQTAIEDILFRQGVEPFSVETIEFDPRRQRAISTLATDDSALNKTVAARLRKGFQAGDKLIRPEVVTVVHAAPGTARRSRLNDCDAGSDRRMDLLVSINPAEGFSTPALRGRVAQDLDSARPNREAWRASSRGTFRSPG